MPLLSVIGKLCNNSLLKKSIYLYFKNLFQRCGAYKRAVLYYFLFSSKNYFNVLICNMIQSFFIIIKVPWLTDKKLIYAKSREMY